MKNHEINLMKAPHYYRFWYDSGREKELIDLLKDLAESKENNLDYFDVSILCYQIGQHLVNEMKNEK